MTAEPTVIAPAGVAHLGIDVGGTLLKGVILTGATMRTRGAPAAVVRRPTEVVSGVDAIVDNIISLACDLAAEASDSGLSIGGLGIAVPGLVDESRGVAVSATNLRWVNLPLAAIVARQLGLPVVLRHDVRSGALAELRLGAAADGQDFVFLPIGTGIACAIVHRSTVYHGEHYRAGEIGHIKVSNALDPCACGRTGCLETIASASAIARRYQQLSGRGGASPEDVIDAVESGDPFATRVWAEAVSALAEAILVSNTLLDIDHYLIGGGLVLAGDRLLRDLTAAVELHPHEGTRPSITAAGLGADAGALGAALSIAEASSPPTYRQGVVPCF